MADFSWTDSREKHIDLLGDRKVARYVYERMDPRIGERTYKPFFHLFDSKGENFVTKGPEANSPITVEFILILQMLCL